MAPYVIVKALGGPMIDRVGPKRVSVIADALSAVVVAIIPLLHLAHWLPYPALLFCVAVAGTVRGPGDAAKATLLPAVAETAAMPLERVTGLYGVTDRLAAAVGAAAGGVLIAWIGPFSALVVDAGTFAFATVIIMVTVRSTQRPEPGGGGYLRRLMVGMEFLRRDGLLRAIAGMVGVTNLIDAGLGAVLLPMWGRQDGGGPAMIGALWGMFGVAAVLASFVAASVGGRLPRRMTYLVAFLVAGAPRILILALDAPLNVVFGVWVIAGFGAGLVSPLLGATIIERTPRPLLGRVTALFGTLSWAGIPVGGPVAGLLVVGFGLNPTIVIGAVGYFIATTLPGRGRQWQEMDRQAAPVGSVPVGSVPVGSGSVGSGAVGSVPVGVACRAHDAGPELKLGARIREVEPVS